METLQRKIIRFAVVGAMNLIVDLAVFNILIAVFGIGRGTFVPLRVTAFLFALANSFIFNKIWEYEVSPGNHFGREAANFAIIGTVGLCLNLTVSYFLFKLGIQFLMAVPTLNIANGAAIAGAFASAILNLFSYTLFIFKPAKRKIAGYKPAISLGSALNPQKS